MNAKRSTTWGGRPPGGGRLRAAGVGVLGAALLATGAAPAAAATVSDASTGTTRVVVSGAGATEVALALGIRDAAQGLPSVTVASVTAAQAAGLRAAGLSVVPDAPVQLQAFTSNEKSKAGRVNAYYATGSDQVTATGRGVTIAVLDSGVDEVPGLTGRVVQGANFTDESSRDLYGHGTFVAGLAAGDGTGSAGEHTGIVGTAPQARILSVKVADAQGRSSVGQVVLGLAWTIKNRDVYGIKVANLSLAVESPSSYLTDAVDAVAEAAWFSGITVVASAGNDGKTVQSAPGNDPFVLTVGSVYDNNTKGREDDIASTFSNDGKTPDGVAKPEIRTTGQHVQSTLPVGSTLAKQQTTRGLPAGYGQMSGTSMSTGVASGVAAALYQAQYKLTPDQVKTAMVSGSKGRILDAGQVAAQRPAAGAGVNAGLSPSMALAFVYAEQVAKLPVDKVVWANVTWSNVTWSSATWSNATWSSATWSNATWSNATWSNATWSSATWSNATWSNATWSNATWSSATWSSASQNS